MTTDSKLSEKADSRSITCLTYAYRIWMPHGRRELLTLHLVITIASRLTAGRRIGPVLAPVLAGVLRIDVLGELLASAERSRAVG